MKQINLEFWRDELDTVPIQASDAVNIHVNGKLNSRVMSILSNRFEIPDDISLKEMKERLSENPAAMSYLLSVLKFGKRKANIAIVGVAEKALSEEELSQCRDKKGEYDRHALLFLLYFKDPANLKYVNLYEKIHRAGFAQMVLPGENGKPRTEWAAFMSRDNIQPLLREYEAKRGEMKVSLCEEVLDFGGRLIVFIKREEREDFVIIEGRNVFGHRPEWIILDFEGGAKRVRISSLTTDVSLDIANKIASGFYGIACEYENEKDLIHASVIEEFLERICFSEPDLLPVVEIVVGDAPLDGAPMMKLSNRDSKSIGKAIRQFSDRFGSLLGQIDLIESIKVRFKHRISVLFDQCDDDPDLFVVRYSDSRLNALERVEFEKFLEEEFGIHVLSTEKR